MISYEKKNENEARVCEKENEDEARDVWGWSEDQAKDEKEETGRKFIMNFKENVAKNNRNWK